MRSHKAPRMLIQPQCHLSLLRVSPDSKRGRLTMDLPESSRCWEWWGLLPARALPAFGIAIESSSIRTLEFQSLIAFAAAASSAADAGTAHELRRLRKTIAAPWRWKH